MKTAAYWIVNLQLSRHPEGGYYREIYRSIEIIPSVFLAERYQSPRNFSTSIYFLLEGHDFSAFHRLKSDEIWHFYEGSSLEIIMIDKSGNLNLQLAGSNFEAGEKHQVIVQSDTWFAARVKDKTLYSLVGCTVAPGFDFTDFELGEQEKLLQLFPQHEVLIRELTRPV
jgi:predicted cupin superfamily sugar epimerase